MYTRLVLRLLLGNQFHHKLVRWFILVGSYSGQELAEPKMEVGPADDDDDEPAASMSGAAMAAELGCGSLLMRLLRETTTTTTRSSIHRHHQRCFE